MNPPMPNELQELIEMKICEPVCDPTLTECPRCHNDISKCDGEFKVKGSWSVGQFYDDFWIQSNDSPNDVILRITGEFADDEQRFVYATELCRRLNKGNV